MTGRRWVQVLAEYRKGDVANGKRSAVGGKSPCKSPPESLFAILRLSDHHGHRPPTCRPSHWGFLLLRHQPTNPFPQLIDPTISMSLPPPRCRSIEWRMTRPHGSSQTRKERSKIKACYSPVKHPSALILIFELIRNNTYQTNPCKSGETSCQREGNMVGVPWYAMVIKC